MQDFMCWKNAYQIIASCFFFFFYMTVMKGLYCHCNEKMLTDHFQSRLNEKLLGVVSYLNYASPF